MKLQITPLQHFATALAYLLYSWSQSFIFFADGIGYLLTLSGQFQHLFQVICQVSRLGVFIEIVLCRNWFSLLLWKRKAVEENQKTYASCLSDTWDKIMQNHVQSFERSHSKPQYSSKVSVCILWPLSDWIFQAILSSGSLKFCFDYDRRRGHTRRWTRTREREDWTKVTSTIMHQSSVDPLVST